MCGADESTARVQVVQGCVVVCAGLARRAERESVSTPWIESLIDGPGTLDRLNMTLFALMGFVAADSQGYVHALNVGRHRIGGHELRPFPVVAASGPTDAGVTYTLNFTTWQSVIDGITKMMAALQE